MSLSYMFQMKVPLFSRINYIVQSEWTNEFTECLLYRSLFYIISNLKMIYIFRINSILFTFKTALPMRAVFLSFRSYLFEALISMETLLCLSTLSTCTHKTKITSRVPRPIKHLSPTFRTQNQCYLREPAVKRTIQFVAGRHASAKLTYNLPEERNVYR